MKNWASNTRCAAIITLALVAFPVAAAVVQLISKPDSSFAPSASGGGDSGLPIISADGRYVLFASTANNLALMSNSNPAAASFPATINVFLRDRASNTTSLVSINLAGLGGGNGDSFPAGISTNGQFALFESTATDLVASDTNNLSDVFVRDLINGATMLVSVSTNNGDIGSGISRDPVMTPDGRYIAFVSTATNLVAGDTNRMPDIFVRDLQSGTTSLVTVGAKSTNSMQFTGSSELPAITPNGRYVAFYSTATNLVAGITRPGEVYVRDLVSETTARASTNARAMFQSVTGSTNAVSYSPTISDDGRYVAFLTSSNFANTRGIILRHDFVTGLTDLVHTNVNVPKAPFDNIRSPDMTPDGRFIAFVANIGNASPTNTAIYLWDAQTGTNTLISGDLSDALPAGAICDSPIVSSNGQFVAFLSSGSNLVANVIAGDFHLYVRDTQAGTTRLADVDMNGIGAGVNPTTVPSMSADAQFVAFDSAGGTLVSNDRNRSLDVFMRDLATDITELISLRDSALPSETPNGFSGALSFSVSADGRYAAFASEADDITLNDTNGLRDVFVRDSLTGTNALVSVDTNGIAGSGVSMEPAISGDGRYVAFTSSTTNLVAGDTNKALDVFVRDLQTATTVLVSVNSSGTGPGNSNSYSPVISADGRFVLFRSKASDLAVGPFSGSENLFLHDVQLGTNYALTTAGVASAAMTPDGRSVAFTGSILGGTPTRLYVWDSLLSTRVYTNTRFGITGVGIAISPDGNRLAYTADNQLFVADRAANTDRPLNSGRIVFGTRPEPHFSGSGRFLVYSLFPLPFNLTNQVYLFDFLTVAELLVSKRFNSTDPANNASDSPTISPDARFIAYCSAATNIVAGDSNGVPDLFVYDRVTGATVSPTQKATGNTIGNNRSLTSFFSGDGRMLFFKSRASGLIARDFNSSGDVFAFTFLYAAVGGTPGEGFTISWPVVPGESYVV